MGFWDALILPYKGIGGRAGLEKYAACWSRGGESGGECEWECVSEGVSGGVCE